MRRVFISTALGVAAVSVLAAAALVGYLLPSKSISLVPDESSHFFLAPEAVKIISVDIKPWTADGGWVMYGDDAQLVVKATGVKSAKAFFYPTGTGVGEYAPNGVELGVLKPISDDTWAINMPPGILATSLWVIVTGNDGASVKSSALGNVGYQR